MTTFRCATAAIGLGLGLGLVAAGCSPARHRAESDIVRDIHFTGNGGFFSGHNDYQLRTQMQQQQSRFGLLVWPFIYTVTPKTIDMDRLVRDAYRLEVWYAHRGWFDARVEGWHLDRVRTGGKRRAAVFDIHGTIVPGEQSSLRTLDVVGLPPALHLVRNATLRKAPIRTGDPFDLGYLEATRRTLEGNLQDYARPYAKVDLRVDAKPEEHAVDAVLEATPGILGKIGEVTIEGPDKVPERFVAQAAALETGSPYSLTSLREAQRKLFAMGTFSIVEVEPDLSDPTSPEVPVRVKVSESKFRTWRIGGGFDYDGFLPVVRAQTRLRHVNLFRQLINAELALRAGVALDVVQGGDVGGIPTGGVDLNVSYPRLLGGRASVDLKATFEQDVYTGLWAYRRPVVDMGLVYRFDDALQIRIGPHFENYAFLGEFGPRIQAAQQRLFGIEGEDAFQYELTALDQLITLDWTNDPVHPTRGSHTTLSLREAVPLSDIGYGFIRGSGEVKRYLPLRAADKGSAFPVTLVGRLRATAVVPYGKTDVIPLPERAFLGGATSIRGFRQNQVGPYTTLCTYESVGSRRGFLGLGGPAAESEEVVVRYHLPKGGTVSSEGGAEVRYDWIYGVTLAAFADAGILADTISALSGDGFRFSGGIGARYNTIAGPLRFDLSFRPLYPEDQGPTNFTLCRDGADEVSRVSDFFSNFSGLRGDRHPPFAMVFYITFGESL